VLHINILKCIKVEMHRQRMRVLFTPADYGNPYQSMLIKNLADLDICVDMRGDFPIKKFLMRRYSCDVWHMHWVHYGLQHPLFIIRLYRILRRCLRLLILRVFGIRIIWTVHNMVHHDTPYLKSELLYDRLLCLVAHSVILHSEACKNLFIERLRLTNIAKLYVVPHGNYIGCYANVVSKTQSYERLYLPLNCRVFLYFGAIRPYKGIETLVSAYSTAKSCENSRLLIVGRSRNTEYREHLLSLARLDNRINFHFSFIADDELQYYFNAASVVVFPFKTIFTSGSVILAMSLKKAIIAPKTSTVSELLAHEDDFLYSRDKGLGSVLQEAMSCDESILTEKGIRNFNKALQFDWKTITKKTADIYKHI
jgi:beta-1,4-mannosyltransferase